MSTAAPVAGGSGALAALREYRRLSELPLTILVFLTPIIIAYEIGTIELVPDQRIIAFKLMRDFFFRIGASARYLPPFTVAAILLATHVIRRDPWQLEVTTAFAMAIESIALAMPLLLVASIFKSYLPLPTCSITPGGFMVLSLGAGVYEELLFRLILFGVLSLVFDNYLHCAERTRSGLLIVVISAVSFSAYHYLGGEQFQWGACIFRTAAGIYFGGLFLLRGFGITAGAHAAYDVSVVLAMQWGL